MLDHRSLKDHVYEYLSAQINSGSIRPHVKINENAVCQALNISRTPVREALMQLAAEGCVEQIPRRGFMVREIPEERAREIYEVLGCLEAKAAERAVDRITEPELRKLRQLVDRMDRQIQEGRFSDYYQTQLQFHDLVNDAGQNQELCSLIRQLKKNFLKQSYTAPPGDDDFGRTLKRTNDGHRIMLQLLENREPEALKKYIETVHWNFGYAGLETLE